MFFKHFASKNQLPGLSVSGTLVVMLTQLNITFQDQNTNAILELNMQINTNSLVKQVVPSLTQRISAEAKPRAYCFFYTFQCRYIFRILSKM